MLTQRQQLIEQSIAAEAAFAPQLVKQAAKMGSAQRFFNLGLILLWQRVARIASPLGIASLGAEGLYQAGKFTKRRIDELRSMTPEQRAELRRQQEAQAFQGLADGGLAKEAGEDQAQHQKEAKLTRVARSVKRVKKLIGVLNGRYR